MPWCRVARGALPRCGMSAVHLLLSIKAPGSCSWVESLSQLYMHLFSWLTNQLDNCLLMLEDTCQAPDRLLATSESRVIVPDLAGPSNRGARAHTIPSVNSI